MKKKDETKGGSGYWFERSKHWCQYPVAVLGPVSMTADAGDRKRPGQEPRPVGSRPKRAARRLYAKHVRNSLAMIIPGFKAWLRAQA